MFRLWAKVFENNHDEHREELGQIQKKENDK